MLGQRPNLLNPDIMIDAILVAAIISGPNKQPTSLQYFEPPKIEQKIEELTLEEKIKTNFYKCTDKQYIRADNAQCKDKIVPTLVRTINNTPAGNTAGNTYAAGNCTWYAKSQRPDLPNRLGNADRWLYGARAAGFATGTTPQIGAVAVTRAYSHVSIVIAFTETTTTVKEMNYKGYGIISTRTAPISEFDFIY